MRLNPKEQEKLMLHMAGMLAKERKDRESHPETAAGRTKKRKCISEQRRHRRLFFAGAV